MFKEGLGINKTYIAAGYTDLRQGIDGLASRIILSLRSLEQSLYILQVEISS